MSQRSEHLHAAVAPFPGFFDPSRQCVDQLDLLLEQRPHRSELVTRRRRRGQSLDLFDEAFFVAGLDVARQIGDLPLGLINRRYELPGGNRRLRAGGGAKVPTAPRRGGGSTACGREATPSGGWSRVAKPVRGSPRCAAGPRSSHGSEGWTSSRD